MEPEATPAVDTQPEITSPVSDSGTETQQPTTFGDMMKGFDESSTETESSPSSQPETVVDSKPEQTGNNQNQGYITRLRSENKSLRQMYKDTQTELDRLRPPGAVAPTLQASPLTPTDPDEAALSLLDQRLERVLERKLQPVLNQVTQQQQEQIWNDFEQQQFVQEMKPQILQELNNLDPNLPLQQRLEYARSLAIAKNIDTVIRVNREVAAEQATENAYKNQDLKRSQRGGGPRPANPTQSSDDLLTRVKEGRVSTTEWRERATEIDALIEQDTLGAASQ